MTVRRLLLFSFLFLAACSLSTVIGYRGLAYREHQGEISHSAAAKCPELSDQFGHAEILGCKACGTEESCDCSITCVNGVNGMGVEGVKVCRNKNGRSMWVDPSKETYVEDIPLCMERYTLQVVDSVTTKPLPKVTVSLQELGPDNKKIGKSFQSKTNDAGVVAFSTFSTRFQLQIVGDKASYRVGQRIVDRTAECPGTEGSCKTQYALAPILRGPHLQEGCSFSVTDAGLKTLDLDFMTVLEWTSRKPQKGSSVSTPDLDMWVRPFDCFNHLRKRKQCNFGGSLRGDDSVPFDDDLCKLTPFTTPEVKEKEQQVCGMKKCGKDGCTYHDNQFPKWIDEYTHVNEIDNIQYRWNKTGKVLAKDAEGWPEKSFMKMRACEKGGDFGMESVTYHNPPPGTYQVVVNEVDVPIDQPMNPIVTFYIGDAAFECALPNKAECSKRKDNLWNVANIRVDYAGKVYNKKGDPTGERVFRTTLVDTAAVVPLRTLSLPTSEVKGTVEREAGGVFAVTMKTEEYFKSPYEEFSQDSLDEACIGTCHPVNTASENAKCLARCDEVFGGCAAPSGIPQAAKVSCKEGACIGPRQTCTPACVDGYKATVDSLKCEDSDFLPSGFQCEPAPCDVEGSNKLPGKKCACTKGFYGTISWKGEVPEGKCEASPCEVDNAKHKDGKCTCNDGFKGDLEWVKDTIHGKCEPAPCNVENSDKKSGTECQCLPGFSGTISWTGSTAEGVCKPVECNVENSNMKPGSDCACAKGYVGKVVWDGAKLSSKSKCADAKKALEDWEAALDRFKQKRDELMKRKNILSLEAAVKKGKDPIWKCCCRSDGKNDPEGQDNEFRRCKALAAFPDNVDVPVKNRLRLNAGEYECPAKLDNGVSFVVGETDEDAAECMDYKSTNEDEASTISKELRKQEWGAQNAEKHVKAIQARIDKQT
mmetsp:Transcript_34400/g.73277  ORF Transcript_34400/g.73277 Transcript_34400/m.73277 type:complete len:930 (-) Transcript_34400:167-2956(-)